jgi:hypothetical protein
MSFFRSISTFLREKPVSITALSVAVMNLLATLNIDPFTSPDVVSKINLVVAAFLGLFVTKTVTANVRLTGKALGGYGGVSIAPDDEVALVSELAATDYPEEEGEHEVPADLLELFTALDAAGVTPEQFREAFE